MGIMPSQFRIIWQAIDIWIREKQWTPAVLAWYVLEQGCKGYNEKRIATGIRNETEEVTSDFLHACVEVFGLRSSRQRGIEETVDVLTDEECIEALTAPLRFAQQARLFDN